MSGKIVEYILSDELKTSLIMPKEAEFLSLGFIDREIRMWFQVPESKCKTDVERHFVGYLVDEEVPQSNKLRKFLGSTIVPDTFCDITVLVFEENIPIVNSTVEIMF